MGRLSLEKDVVFVNLELNEVLLGMDGNGSYTREKDTTFKFDSAYTSRFGIRVDLELPIIEGQLTEKATLADGQHQRLLNIWLPHLAGLALDTFVKLRHDEADSFVRLHYALRDVVHTSQTLASSRAVVELGKHVDYEVRTFNERMKVLKGRYPSALAKLAFGSFAIGLCSMLPSDIAKVLSGVVGNFQIRDAVVELIEMRQQQRELRGSDFYLAWYLDNYRKRS